MAEPLPIVLYPSPGLRKRTEPVAEVNDHVREMAERMIVTMHGAHGLGIAAPQVGWNRRVCIVSGTGDAGDEIVLINPEIVEDEGRIDFEEGCLSFPGIAAVISRAEDVVVEAVGLDGKPFRLEATGLLGRCILHEVDHLDGVLFTTRFTPADKIRNKRALKQLEDRFERERTAGAR
ncbi:MAG: peptide deformylase [Planctomycetota bacterium]|jgi:peptide deformylase